MQLRLIPYRLQLKETFVIARDAYAQKNILIVALSDGTHTGFGEACEHVYYQVTVPKMQADLEKIRPLIESIEIESPITFFQKVQATLQHSPFALCALDQAMHDLYGKKINKPTHQILGVQPNLARPSNYTIGIGTIEEMIAKVQQNPYPIYKIKLGTPNDIEIVAALRQHTKALFRIDANCAWTADETIRKAKELKRLGVELVEQPLPADKYEVMEEVLQKSVLPLIADESCCTLSNIAKCANRFHGINIKLMKCGGITPALQMIKAAKKHQLQIMLGCMTEGSIGISALAQLAPLADYLDADAALLIANDHSKGTYVGTDGQLVYSKGNGLGVELLS